MTLNMITAFARTAVLRQKIPACLPGGRYQPIPARMAVLPGLPPIFAAIMIHLVMGVGDRLLYRAS